MKLCGFMCIVIIYAAFLNLSKTNFKFCKWSLNFLPGTTNANQTVAPVPFGPVVSQGALPYPLLLHALAIGGN